MHAGGERDQGQRSVAWRRESTTATAIDKRDRQHNWRGPNRPLCFEVGEKRLRASAMTRLFLSPIPDKKAYRDGRRRQWAWPRPPDGRRQPASRLASSPSIHPATCSQCARSACLLAAGANRPAGRPIVVELDGVARRRPAGRGGAEPKRDPIASKATRREGDKFPLAATCCLWRLICFVLFCLACPLGVRRQFQGKRLAGSRAHKLLGSSRAGGEPLQASQLAMANEWDAAQPMNPRVAPRRRLEASPPEGCPPD